MMSTPPTALSLAQLQQLASAGVPPTGQILNLLITMGDSDEETRAWASDVLQSIEVLPQELADSVAANCLDPQPAVAAWACILLGKLESDTSKYQSNIAACLNLHPSVSTRQQAALALGSIAEHQPANFEPATIEALQRAAASDDPRLKRLSAAALATHEKQSS